MAKARKRGDMNEVSKVWTLRDNSGNVRDDYTANSKYNLACVMARNEDPASLMYLLEEGWKLTECYLLPVDEYDIEDEA